MITKKITKQTKEIRHDIYKWLEEKGLKLSDGDKGTLSDMIKLHDETRHENIIDQNKRMEDHMKRCAMARREAHAKGN